MKTKHAISLNVQGWKLVEITVFKGLAHACVSFRNLNVTEHQIYCANSQVKEKFNVFRPILPLGSIVILTISPFID